MFFKWHRMVMAKKVIANQKSLKMNTLNLERIVISHNVRISSISSHSKNHAKGG